MESENNLKPKEVKDLTEIINDYIALQTCSSLSKLLNESIKFKVMILDRKYFNPEKIRLSADELAMCGVRLRGKGDIHIEICYAIKMKYAKMMASKLLGEEVSNEIGEMGASAIQEVANILTGSFFNAMSVGTGFRVDLSTPDYLQGDLSSLVNDSAKDIANLSDAAIIADAELIGETSGIHIHMIIIQNSDDARKLLEQNSKSDPSEFSSIENSLGYETGGDNPELDALVEELEKGVVK